MEQQVIGADEGEARRGLREGHRPRQDRGRGEGEERRRGPCGPASAGPGDEPHEGHRPEGEQETDELEQRHVMEATKRG